MHKLAQPVKVWTWGPFFRHEAPQAGRFRQFTQVDAEALGSDDPSLDAELILLLARAHRARRRRARRGCGCRASARRETRAAYLDELTAYLREHEGELSDEVRERLDQNPLRAFDADHAGTRRVMADAPAPARPARRRGRRALRRGARAARRRRDGVRDRLDAGARARLLHAHGVRVRARAARRAGGARRRRPLRPPVEELGGPPTPGVGWAAGVERILLASDRRARARAAGLRRARQAGRDAHRLRAGAAAARARASGSRWSRPGAR